MRRLSIDLILVIALLASMVMWLGWLYQEAAGRAGALEVATEAMALRINELEKLRGEECPESRE